MAITAGRVARGQVGCDGFNDTHGFVKQDERVWVTYAGDGCRWHKRSIWLDFLGDRYVLGLDGDRFVRLDDRQELWTWEPVDERHPNVAPATEF